MSKYHLSFDKFLGVSTDGATGIAGSKIGLVTKIRAELNFMNLDANEFCVFHCIRHQQNLCAKSIKFTHVISKTVICIHFIKSRALDHH
jgi:hypothetical protein